MSAANRKPAPTPEQQQAADPSHSVWVAASAGSGKTQVLTDRLLRLLLGGADPQSILCLTYTKAAATEMSARLLQRLARWVTLDDAALAEALTLLGMAGDKPALRSLARQLFATALATPGGLKIQTIHAFAERLLQLFPVEAGLAPGFRVMEDQQRDVLIQEALAQALVDSSLATDWSLLTDNGLRELSQLKRVASELLGHAAYVLLLDQGFDQGRIGRIFGEQLGDADRTDGLTLRNEIIAIDTAPFQSWVNRIRSSKECRPKEPSVEKLEAIVAASIDDRLECLKQFFLTKEGTKCQNPIRKKLAESAGLAEAIGAAQDRFHGAFQQFMLWQVWDMNMSLGRCMAVVRQNMETAKRQRGLYDFNDLIARTALLLSTSDQAQWVLYKLDRGLDHVLVDEAQDTSEAQWRIILALVEEFYAGQGQRDTAAAARTTFVVGDRKQSIYSFQGADVDVFDAVRERLTSLSQGALKQIGLAVSFRSLANILSAVDTVFATGARARQGFGTGATEERPHTAARKDHPGIVEFWPLMTREEGDQENYWRAPVNSVSEDHPRRKLAIFVAQTIKGWLGRRQLHGADRPVGPGDILILLQRRSEVFSALIAELHRLGIPVAGADRLELAKQIIVHDFLALAQVLVLPGDDYSLACLLKSPLVPKPVDEDGLFSLAHGRQNESLRQRLADQAGQAENAAALRTYAMWADKLGPYDVFARVAQLRRQAILERLGGEADDAMRVLLDLALAYERDEGPTLAGFANWLKSTDFELKREMEEAAGQVRIMTVHGAKGLEAPIVILADAADIPQAKSPSGLQRTRGTEQIPGFPVFVPDGAADAELINVWKDDRKQRAFEERMRLFYVAMTRARDEIYLCGSFNKNAPSEDSWWKLAEVVFAGEPFRGVTLTDGRVAKRLGPDDVAVPATATKEDERGDTPLPDWLVTHTPHGSTARKHLARDSSDIDLAAARRGIAIHGLLEALMDLPADRRVELAHARGKRNGLEASLVDRLLALIGNPQTAFFFQPGSQAEVELGGRADDGAAVLGRIDRLAWHEGALCILDYKSARQPATSLPSDHAYVRQLSTYARLLGQAYPGTPVRAAVLWTQSGELEWLPAAFLANPS